MGKRTTLKDIAEKAGITPMAVSLALRKDKSIPETTRKRVQGIAKKLHYYPNQAAQTLVGGKTGTIAIVAPYFYPPFIREVIQGIEKNIAKTDYNMNYFSTGGAPESTEEILQKILYGNVADGAIIISISNKFIDARQFKSLKLPVVIIEEKVKELNNVTADNTKGGFMATEHLICHSKCKNIAVVTGSKKHSGSLNDRVRGYKKALKKYGLTFDKKNVIEAPHLNFQEGKELFNSAIKGRKDIDAIFCAGGDSLAIGIMHEARANGIKIPGDLAIIGYDNRDVSEFVTPALTTIEQPIQDMSQKAVEILLKALSSKKQPGAEKIIFDAKLIKRDSA